MATMPMVFGLVLTLLTLFLFFSFFQAYVLRLKVSVRAMVSVYLSRLVRFYQAYCTLVVHCCYVTGGE